MKNNVIELTVLMPCLNEEETLEVCLQKSLEFFEDNKVSGEVVVADNGSTDASIAIAEKYTDMGVRVVNVPIKGYGSALIEGTKASKGKYVIMGDADDSYDFSALMPYLEKLREGNDLVMGDRFAGGIEPGAMPPLHRYLGNPVLSFLGRILFSSKIRDFHCGLRGYNREKILALGLQTTGMEYASEMVVKCELNNYKITEVPTTLKKDGRNRPPHLRSWRDGWRHLRFLLMYSPKWLFLYPGILFFLVGTIGFFVLAFTSVQLNSVNFDINTLLYFGGFSLLGMETILFSIYTSVYAYQSQYIPVKNKTISRLEKFTVEKGVILGLLLFLGGIILGIISLVTWKNVDFNNLDPVKTMRLTIPSMILIVMGLQLVFSSFFIGILEIKHQK